ncbi:MAG: hypothetical protein A2046_02655 [Bacteroidetes bacterium GWA2_30_7]|nr:MAG: hypothetical protein A2046_02655 [Bacteroidetes bacterium GWA2_30_7]
MKNLTLLSLIFAFIFFNFNTFAQKDEESNESNSNPKHINIYSLGEKIETDDYIIVIEDVFSKMDYLKLKIKISNKTSEYLLFKGDECVFKLDNGNFKSKEKSVFIEPFDTKSKVLEIKGDGQNYHVEKFSLEINGIYKVPISEKSFTASNFQLPPNAKDFVAGPFSCILLGTEQKTDETWARFNCKYNGSNVGFINPAKCVAQIPDGQEFSTVNLKSKIEILTAGDDIKFGTIFQIPGKIADMQFTTLNIIWKETFTESTTKPLASQTASFEVDAAKTAIKNK